MIEKYLIVNADDFGMCHAQNLATAELFRCGTVTSATVMAPCPAAADAVRFARENPQFAVGVHLTTTAEFPTYRWSAVCGKHVPSLLDADGFLHRSGAEFAQNANAAEVKTELKAQIEWALIRGFLPSHLDNHMGTMYGVTTGRFALLELAITIAGEYRLPFRFPARPDSRMFANAMLDIKVPQAEIEVLYDRFRTLLSHHGVITPDHLMPGDWNGAQAESFENYKEYIYELYRSFDHGVTETYIHPAVECDEIKQITPLWQRRCWEYQLFRDPQTLQHIQALGIKLINYRDLARMRK